MPKLGSRKVSFTEKRRQDLLRQANSIAMRSRVMDAVIHGRGKGGRIIQTALGATKTQAYPTRMLGDKSKVPRESYQGWGHIPMVRKAIGNPHIPGKIIHEALYKRSAKAYEAEWSAAEKNARNKKVVAKAGTEEKMDQWAEDIDWNIGNANAMNGRNVASEVKRRIVANARAGQLTTLIDLGSGAGKTIIPAIENLSPSQRKKVKVVCVDVSSKDFPKILHGSPEKKKPGLLELGVPKENIVLVNASFGNLLKDPQLKKLVGEADVVTSGAALHHLSKSQTVFSEVQKLLKKGGSFKFWDWSHPAWRAPNLVVAPQGAQVSTNGRAYKFRGKIVRAEGGTAFVSRQKSRRKNLRSELAQTREMLSTWVSLLNFSEAEKETFKRWFDSKVETGQPINFESYLRKLQGTRLAQGKKEASIEVMEAHKTWKNYERALKGSGLGVGNPVFSPDSGLLVHYSARK